MNKIKVLTWCDSPTASTGFGTVCRNIIGAIYATGKYEIHQLAINYHGTFVDREKFPWQLSPARLTDPNDPYGTKMFLQTVQDGDYDIVWILNDTFVVQRAVDSLKAIFANKQKAGKKIPTIIYYYPVDCKIKKEAAGMIELADFKVAYTKHGLQETLKVLPHLEGQIEIIHHGTDTTKFFPYSKRIISILKKDLFNLKEDDYIIINVNRNTVRKQLTRTLLCFVEFRKNHPNAYLYLHTNPHDRGIDLLECMDSLGLQLNKDVFMPPGYSPSKGVSDELLNQLYNCGDMFLTTHLGEGWGLTVTEAMACGVPVVAPANTSMPEIIGYDRGNLYPCKEKVYVDLSGYREQGLISDIVLEMEKVYSYGWKHSSPKIAKARKWVEENNWDIINKRWLDIFEKASSFKKEEKDKNEIGEIL